MRCLSPNQLLLVAIRCRLYILLRFLVDFRNGCFTFMRVYWLAQRLEPTDQDQYHGPTAQVLLAQKLSQRNPATIPLFSHFSQKISSLQNHDFTRAATAHQQDPHRPPQRTPSQNHILPQPLRSLVSSQESQTPAKESLRCLASTPTSFATPAVPVPMLYLQSAG